MKKINNLIAMLLVGLMGVVGMGTVYADEPSTGGTGTPSTGANDNQNSGSTAAADLVSIECNSYKLAIGASTNCTVYVKPSASLVASTATKTVIIKASQSKYLTMSSIVANTGFTKVSDDISDKTLAENTITLTYSGNDLKEGVRKDIFSFNLKLEEEAKNLTTGDCGQICITGAMFDSNKAKVGEKGKACPNIIITEQTCEGKDCNPDTGAFVNYAMVAGAAGVALVAIAVVSRKKKFYTV